MKYTKQYFEVLGDRLTAGEVHEYYGVNVSDLLAMHQHETQEFNVGGYSVVVTRL